MLFDHKYAGSSRVSNSTSGTGVSLAPDLNREPTFFVGQLQQKLPFREAISALHDVVVADFNFQPKDKTAYKEWLKEQESIWIADALKGSGDLEQKISALSRQLSEVRSERSKEAAPFYTARGEYYRYLYKRDYAAWFVLDPVITVHPDQVFFECFSKDESAYGKLACSYNVFKHISEFECGTTNIDYSESLYTEFQKIRTYKNTDFKIDPSGFEVSTGEDDYKEVKIDLPESWVRGFLQVSTAMTFRSISFVLSPMDVSNFLSILKRNKERKGPRSIRYVLEPGKPIKAIFEPWNFEVVCSTIYQGDRSEEVRVWGRRRLLMLERLLPVSRSITVNLLGTGMPSFYMADLGDMTFTLGLSGWTANDWSHASQLDLMAPKDDIDPMVLQGVYRELRKKWMATGKELAEALKLDLKVVEQAMTTFAQAGKVIYDIENQVYRVRELKKEGVDLESLRYSSDLEREGVELAQKRAYGNFEMQIESEHKILSAKFAGVGKTILKLDKDDHIVDGKCACSYYYQNGMKKGPCPHMIALRLAQKNERN